MTIAVSLQKSKEMTLKKSGKQFSQLHTELSQKVRDGFEVSDEEICLLKAKLVSEWNERKNKTISYWGHKMYITLGLMVICTSVLEFILDTIGVVDKWILCLVYGTEIILFLPIFLGIWCRRRRTKQSSENVHNGDIEKNWDTRLNCNTHEKSNTEKLKILAKLHFEEEGGPFSRKMRLLSDKIFYWDMYAMTAFVVLMWIFSFQQLTNAFLTYKNEETAQDIFCGTVSLTFVLLLLVFIKNMR